jgi:septum site-determining protein MinC
MTQANERTLSTPPFDLKGRMMTLTVLNLWSTDLEKIERQLAHKVRQVPGFFRDTPLILDFAELPSEAEPLSVSALVAMVKRFGFVPVAVRGVNKAYRDAALAAQLGVLADSKIEPSSTSSTVAAPTATRAEAPAPEKPKPTPAQAPAEVPPPASAKGTPTLVVTQPVRSGQQVYARGGDLVVMATVSAGAEILADGHIHVYGTLRGRALAGVRGDASARIFCQALDAELVSVAGQYRVNEDLKADVRGIPVQIYLQGEALKIERL